MTISIVRIDEADWRFLRDLHLKSLKADPGVFGSTYEKEVKYSKRKWRAYLRSTDNGVWAIFDGDRAVGMTGVNMDRHDPSRRRAILWGSWLEPAYRGRGLAHKMYQTRISWAHHHPYCETLIVSHRAGNEASRRAILRSGFVQYHTESKLWPDGARADNIFYSLSVRPPEVERFRPPE